MTSVLQPYLVRVLLGFLIGAVLGFAARRGRFCTLGALEDAFYARDLRRLRAWILAVAVAMAGVALLQRAGLDLDRSLYASGTLQLGPLVIGGLTFGVGMALVGNCAFGNLLRLGGGDLKALVAILVLAISAMMAMRGLTALARVAVIDPMMIALPPGRSQLLPSLLAIDPGWQPALGLALAALLATLALADASFRRDRRSLAGGVAIGLCVAAGWWATGIAGYDSFDIARPASFSFARPVGDTVLYGMLASGLKPDFAVSSVIGVLCGAFVEALQAGQLRWDAPDDAGEMKRHVLGAFLMGTGGVTALGCTIGQGVTGLSTLSLGSVIATGSIALGARAGLYILVERGARFARA